jgi:DNA-binding response OmpR family regulator
MVGQVHPFFATNCIYNKTLGEIHIKGEETIILPKNEKKLLDILLKNKNQLVNKEYLEYEIFDMECSDSSLKNLVYRLKKRLNSNIIVNIKDLGYMVTNYE